MPSLAVYSARDLRLRAGELFRDAESGRLAILTKHGKPVVMAVPFDDRLVTYGVHRALALSLFEAGLTTLAQAARIAGLSLEELIGLLGELGINAVDYPTQELDEEFEAAL
jgi:predicted HTH domain antitoxin